MRISSNTIFDSNVATLSQQQSRLIQTQQQIATGRRVLTAADDPVAATRALDIAQSDAINTQYAANRAAARHSTSLAESSLQSVTTLLQDAKSTAVAAGNGSLNNTDRQTLAAELNGRLQELMGLANATDGAGNYLFSGYQSGTQPFANVAGVMSYAGDDGQRAMQVSQSRQLASTDSGADIFMRVKNGNGTFVTQASTLVTNVGTGVISAGSVTNPAAITGDSYTLAFGTVVTQAGVANTGTGVISTATGSNPATNYSVTFTSATTFNVTDLTAVPTATVLAAQPYTAGAPIAFNGISFNIQGAPATGDVFNVTPPVTNTFTVTNNTTGLPVTGMMAQPFVSGQQISFAGMQFDIQGTPIAGDQFTVSPSVNVSLFKTISDFVGLLNTPVTAGNAAQSAALTKGIDTAINGLDRSLTNVLSTRSSLGLRLQELDSLQTAGENLGLQYKQSLSVLQDVDYNKALSDLTQQQITLQAAQKSFVKVADLSLFTYL
jgi:flagellar hook-associated protein 3 FlgL